MLGAAPYVPPGLALLDTAEGLDPVGDYIADLAAEFAARR